MLKHGGYILEWRWYIVPEYTYITPDWSGPYCWKVSCCEINRGNLTMDESVDIADLTLMIDYLFVGAYLPECDGFGNVDGVVTGTTYMDIADLTYFVDYMFYDGPHPRPVHSFNVETAGDFDLLGQTGRSAAHCGFKVISLYQVMLSLSKHVRNRNKILFVRLRVT